MKHTHSLRTLPLLLATALAAMPALADMDHAAEARRQAARDATAQRQAAADRENAQRRAAAEAQGRQAMQASKRKTLGAAAHGKSDAEVDRLHQEHVRAQQAKSLAAAGKAQEIQQKLSTGQGAAAVRQVTGHSTQELMNMSEEQLEALSRDLERKHAP